MHYIYLYHLYQLTENGLTVLRLEMLPNTAFLGFLFRGYCGVSYAEAFSQKFRLAEKTERVQLDLFKCQRDAYLPTYTYLTIVLPFRLIQLAFSPDFSKSSTVECVRNTFCFALI